VKLTHVVCFLLFLHPAFTPAQGVMRRALFLGNSYTYVNNLPLLTAAIAHTAGDSLYFDSNTPGGYTLGWQPIAHATDPVSLAKIQSGNWDFVILQEQSQIPSITRLRDSCMFPASTILHNMAKATDPCTRVLFYLTWGRRFGGMQCFEPNYCSPDFTGFSQMQDSVSKSYKMVADSLHDWIAPVGEAWRFVLGHIPMVLHDADNSHPNLNGSYLAACVFYDVMFGKPSAGNTFTAGLSPDTALMLQTAADSITFGYAGYWNLYNDTPLASFSLTSSSDTVFTHNVSSGATHWLWDFGNGQTSTEFEPVILYPFPGNYTIKLQACNDCYCDSAFNQVVITVIAAESHKDHAIILTGPDQDGVIHFQNFTGNGTLLLYDLTGRIIAELPAIAGASRLTSYERGGWIWILQDPDKKTLAKGKRILPETRQTRSSSP